MKKTVFCRVLCIVLLISWAITIFVFSSQDATKSSELSGGIVDKIVYSVYPDFDELNLDEQTQITKTFSLIIRKAAHFSEYFILGLLSVITLFVFKRFKMFFCSVISFVFCLVYAAGDEIHQYFVPGRACRFTDICIDGAGAALAIVIFALIKHKKAEGPVNCMRKKILVEQNLSLFEDLQKTKHELEELKKLLDKNNSEIINLKEQLETEKEKKAVSPTVTEPMRRLEEKVLLNATLKPDMEYGAQVIGKIVVAAAEYSNKITTGGDESCKELINLILGKTEISKAEILSVIETNDSFENKCDKMNKIADNAKEYFDSIMAQII